MSSCRLVQIEVRDFKSFGGQHLIGPFKDFTGIVGPNGSGKSNVLDSLAFAFYLDINPRSTAYIHSVIGDNDKATSCSVKVTIEEEEGKKKKKKVRHTYERIYSEENEEPENTHYIDDKEVDEEKYKDTLLSKGFHPLIFVKQAEVDAVARKTPIELTQLFEEMSGSKEYAKRYDELRIESEAAHEAVAMIEKRRRAAISEKRHISDRKDEASRYRELAKEEEKILIESSLFQLYHMNRQLEDADEKSTACQQKQIELSSKSNDSIESIKQLEFVKLQTTNKFVDIDAHFREVEQKLRDANANSNRAKTVERILADRLESTKVNLETTANDEKRRQENLERYKIERDEVENKLASLPVVKEIEDEITEYRIIREQASKQFDDITQALRKAMAERADVQRQIDDLQEQQKTLEASKERLQENRENCVNKKKRSSELYEKDRRAIDNSRGEKKMKEVENNSDSAKQSKMMSELRELEKKYEEIRRIEGGNARREKLTREIAKMQRLIPGVYGRFSELVRTAHSKYDVAAARACGSYADAIVVKDNDVAVRCVKFMKEQGSINSDCLPLQNLRPLKVTTKKTVRRLNNFMKYDPMYAPAVEFVCGHIALADSLEEAKKLSQEENITVVTMDGIIYSANGIITGGTTRNKPRYTSDSAEKIEEQRKKLEKDLAQIGNAIEARKRDIEKLEETLLSLEPQMNHRKQQVLDYENTLKQIDIDIRTTDRNIKKVTEQISGLEKTLKQKTDEVEKVNFQNAKNDEKIFKDFCAKAGVKDVKEFEITRLQSYSDRYKERLNLESRLKQLKAFIADEERTLGKATMENLDGQYQDLENQLKNTREEVQQYAEEYAELKEQLEEVKKERETILSEDQSNIDELKQLRKEYQDITSMLESCTYEMTEAEHEKQAALQVLSSVLQQCRLSNIKLPKNKNKNKNKDAESEEVDLINTPSSLTQENMNRSEVEGLSFSSLTVAQKVAKSPEEFKNIVKEYDEKLNSVRGQIARIHPDLKSDDRFTEVEKELEKISNDQEELRQKASQLKKEFIEVKTKRRDLFMKLYDAVDMNIDKTYKKLTRVRNQENRSGTAYLALEDTDEPYLGGIKYTAMPPHKRFRDLEQLSGGEKAVASLALVIALQKNTESPFILMDEPDASLDKLNLRSAAAALNEISQTTQIVSVSLRDKFFEHSDVLVGIYKDKDNQSSGVITLNLSEFIEQNLEMEALE